MISLSNTMKKIGRGALIGLAGTLLASLLWFFGVLDVFEAKTWDWRQRMLAKPGSATSEVALILLDQNSLDWAKEENGLSWPWPREIYTYIISFCKRAGAKALAFDVLYLEPSKYGVYDDEAFGSAAGEFGNFIGTVFLGQETGSEESWPEDVAESGIDIAGLDQWLESAEARGLEFPRASFPIPELAQNARFLANVHLDPDPDGIYRKGRLFQLFDGKTVPSLALALYVVGEGGDQRIRIDGQKLLIDDHAVPIDSSGSTILRYRGPSGTHATYSAAAILQSETRILSDEKPVVDPSVLKGRYVIFGFSAPGLHDLRSSPVAGVYTGVEIHATMLDNLLSSDYMRSVPRGTTILIALFFTILAGVLVSSVSGALKSTAVYAVALPLPPLASLLFFSAGSWLALMFVEIAAIVTLVGASLANYATEGRQKRYIKGAFKQYLSPAVIEELIAHPDRLKLGGERRELSIFFSDLQGFTSISEGLTPEELTALLNEYLSAMTDIIQEEGGTVDKYEGDAIIAFWNAPLDQVDHAMRAVRSALRCQAALAEMRLSVRERIGKDLYMRIGLNTGPAVVGNMGSHTRFDYTMLGDAVNLAARLEGINKQFRTYTMISQSTLDHMGDIFPARELSRVAVVGRKEPVTVYEPMLEEDFRRKEEILPVFSRGLEAFYAGDFVSAQKHFGAIADRDPAASCYVEKCRELLADPPTTWDGVWIMTSK